MVVVVDRGVSVLFERDGVYDKNDESLGKGYETHLKFSYRVCSRRGTENPSMAQSTLVLRCVPLDTRPSFPLHFV